MEPQNYETKIFQNQQKIHGKTKKPEKCNRKRVCWTYQSRGTRKLDNSLKGIQNPIPHKPYNIFKGIRNLVPKGIRSQ